MHPFVPAAELKQKFDAFGHFYSVELPFREPIECRSVLELSARDDTPKDHSELSLRQPDAVVIMMNPGSAKPLAVVRDRLRAESIDELKVSLVPTRPGTTQYQIMRLMHFRNWSHVRVLNLSDLRRPKSSEFFKLFQDLESNSGFDGHSIFSDARSVELSQKIPTDGNTPLVLAWGTSEKLNPLIERCLARLPQKSNVIGLLQAGKSNKYRHPHPSLQSDQREWLEQVLRQLENQEGQAR